MLNNNYKNEAMNLMDQLKKAEETRLAMIKEAQETLVILGAESVVSTVEVQNVITINKGKIVELTKEVEIDNTDYTTIEMLRQTIKDMNNNYDVLLNDYNELETKLAKALNRIAELEQAAVVVEESVIEENKITPAKFLLGRKEDSYRPTREEILAHIYYVHNIPEELRNDEIIEKIFEEYNEMFNKKESGDLKYIGKQAQQILEMKTSYDNKALLLKMKNGYKHYKLPEVIADEQKQEKLRGQRTKIEEEYKEQEMFKNIKEKKETNKQGEYTYEVQGVITVNEQEYTFIFNNSHEKPCLFGCFNEETMEKAKKEINKRFSITKYFTNEKEAAKFQNNMETKSINTIIDFDNKIFAYKEDEHTFKGYIEDYAFVWNTKEDIPCGATVKNALKSKYRKMNESWGNKFPERAQKIKDFCMNNFTGNFNITNDVETTKETITNTNDEIDDDDLLF